MPSCIEGGKIARHLTHQTGLDADIGYLLKRVNPSGHRSRSFHNRFTERLETNGKISTNFDLDANLKLFEKVLTELPAKSIYVGCEIYKVLESRLKDTKSELLSKIYAQRGHEDHFHLRLKCPLGISGCTEEWWVDPIKERQEKANPRPLKADQKAKWNGCG